MPREYRSAVRDAVFALLADGEGRTARQIASELDFKRHSVDTVLITARKNHGASEKGFVIVGYEHTRGTGGREAPVYKLGYDGAVDKPRGKYGAATMREARARYQDKLQSIINGKTNIKRGVQINPWLQLLGMRQNTTWQTLGTRQETQKSEQPANATAPGAARPETQPKASPVGTVGSA
jgi:hypothetical protein